MTKDKQNIDKWSKKIQEALSPNTKILIDIMPQLEQIVGKQPDISILPPEESQNRLNLVLENFLRVFATKEQPLIFFIDDIQWADVSSIKFLEFLITVSKIEYLMIICAYRGNEIDNSHPFYRMIERTADLITINKIQLAPLLLSDILELLSDTLQNDYNTVRPLAYICMKKTKGNPFFLNQFLNLLHRNKLLYFDMVNMKWSWNNKGIEELTVSGDIAVLMSEEMQKLSQNAKECLRFVSCIGNSFDSKLLSLVSNKDIGLVLSGLLEAMDMGLIYQTGETIHSFIHDRVQQAAYFLMEEPIRIKTHLSIGRLLLSVTENHKIKENIFDIVNHLNIGRSLIDDEDEKINLSMLNLEAGILAKASTAYDIAYTNLITGIELLGENAWNKDYKLALSLYTEIIENLYINSDFEKMQTYTQIALKNTKDILDEIRIHHVVVLSYIKMSQINKAIEVGRNVLNKLGFYLPQKPHMTTILKKTLKARIKLREKDIHGLLDMQKMQDPYSIAASSIYQAISTALYRSDPKMLILTMLIIFEMSHKHGYSAQVPLTYVVYATYECSVLGNIKRGYAFGDLGLQLLEKIDSGKEKAKVIYSYYAFVFHWKNHMQKMLDPLMDAYSIALNNGNLEFVAISSIMYFFCSHLMGRNIDDMEHEIASIKNTVKRLDIKAFLSRFDLYQQIFANLAAKNDKPYELKGEYFDEDIQLPIQLKSSDNTFLFLYYFNKTMLNYQFENIKEANELIDEARKYLDAVTGMIFIPVFYLYDTLISTKMFYDYKYKSKAFVLKKVINNMNKMKKWAKYSPGNHLHKYYLIKAEFYRLMGIDSKAMKYYDMAIDTACENMYVNEEGLSNELACQFYYSIGTDKIAQIYIRQAIRCYSKWGAAAKVESLNVKYDVSYITESATLTKSHTTSTVTSASEAIDINSIVKATQAISKEIKIDRLLNIIIQIVIENSGAQKACLIMKKDNILILRAIGIVNGDSIKIDYMNNAIGQNSDDIPMDVIDYVLRSNDSLVIEDSAINDNFKYDEYIIKNSVKSVLCTPIQLKGEIKGIVYLENNLLTGAFTNERLRVLDILKSQLAISLENASLYSNMEELVNIKTRQIAAVNNNLRSLLDNAGQGFMTFGQDLIIKKEYSEECIRIFGFDVFGKLFHELIYTEDYENQNYIKRILTNVFDKNNENMRNIYLDLLPAELFIKDMYINAQYKIIEYNNEQICMVILTDSTYKKELESKILEERNMLKMVVDVVVHYNDFISIVKDYTEFCFDIFSEIVLSPHKNSDKIDRMLLYIHTFKGNFAQMQMKNISQSLHKLETDLISIKGNDDKVNNYIKDLFESNEMLKWLNDDIEVLKNILGEEFINRDAEVAVSKESLLRLEELAQNIADDDKTILIDEIRKLRNRPFVELFTRYTDYVLELSQKLDKLIYPMQIICDDILVDTDYYNDFTKSLVHIFRNCIDHGIESPEEREQAKKDIYGTIKCEIRKKENSIIITISDDGRGIDIEAIKSKAIQKNLFSLDMINKMSQKEILDILFYNDFSLKDSTTIISGRGIGLSAVLYEIQKLKGEILINTNKNNGTDFVFIIPKSIEG